MKKCIVLMIIAMLPSFLYSQAANGVIRRPTKKTEKHEAERNLRPQTQYTISHKERERIIQNLIKNMIFVQGGEITLGATPEQQADDYDEALPPYKVSIGSFWICKYELTQYEWRAIINNKLPDYYKRELYNNNLVGKNKAVEVNWKDAQRLIQTLNILTGLNFRLPTSDEWEYAARGGLKSRGYKYSGSNNIDEIAWYDKNSDIGERSFVVGQKLPNELGIYDMSGNVDEWCSDEKTKYWNSKMQQWLFARSNHRLIRGGNHCEGPRDCKVSRRRWRDMEDYCNTFCFHGTGIRLVCTLMKKGL